MKTLVVAGDDKQGRTALWALAGGAGPAGNGLALDGTHRLGRTFRLLKRGSLRPGWILNMAAAEFSRPAVPSGPWPKVSNNAGLEALARSQGAGRILLYRAGLIVGSRLLASGLEILNIHCASLPLYGGLGALPRALEAGDLDQEACLHRVEARIDAGPVLDREPYRLDPQKSYRENEDTAYAAGRILLLRALA